jgi:hypothetical protein
MAPTAADEYLNPVWAIPSGLSLTQASSTIHLNYNIIDTYFTRVFLANPHLRLRIMGGLTGGWMSQNMTINYTDTALTNNSLDLHWKYWGCGFRFGIIGDWYIYKNIYMTSRATFAGMIGPYENKTLQRTPTLTFRDNTYSDTRPTMQMQLLIGPSWQKAYANSRIEVFAGCEYNIWANLQEVFHSGTGSITGAKEPNINTDLLSFLGLTASVTYDF